MDLKSTCAYWEVPLFLSRLVVQKLHDGCFVTCKTKPASTSVIYCCTFLTVTCEAIAKLCHSEQNFVYAKTTVLSFSVKDLKLRVLPKSLNKIIRINVHCFILYRPFFVKIESYDPSWFINAINLMILLIQTVVIKNGTVLWTSVNFIFPQKIQW